MTGWIIEFLRNGTIDSFEKAQELFVMLPAMERRDHFAGGHIQEQIERWSRCECNRESSGRARPVAVSVLAMCDQYVNFGFSHPHTTLKRGMEDLDSGPRCPHLFYEERIRGQLESFHAMRL